MTNITYIKDTLDVAQTLRTIADEIDAGEIIAGNATLVIGDRVFHMGTVNEATAARDAVWNLNCAIHKLISYEDE